MHLRWMVTRLMVTMVSLAVAASCLFAQQDATFRLDVQRVLVPVVVTDKKGHHVTGLHASDFRIFEDGAQQAIASFSSDDPASADDIGALEARFGRTGAEAGGTATHICDLHR